RCRARRRIAVSVVVGLVAAAAALGAYVIRLNTGEGEVLIQCEDKDVEIAIRRSGRTVETMTLTTKDTSTTVGVGTVEVVVTGPKPEEYAVTADSATLRRGGRIMVTVVRTHETPEAPALSTISAGSHAGQEWEGNGLKMKFCWCPPGTFKMGSREGEAGR